MAGGQVSRPSSGDARQVLPNDLGERSLERGGFLRVSTLGGTGIETVNLPV